MLNHQESTTEGSDNFRKFELNSRFNRISFVLFGVGMLLPWNAMLAAMDFFTDAFPSYEPSFSLLVAVSAPMFGVQALVFFLLQSIPLHFKVTIMFIVSTLVTFGLVLVPIWVSDESTAYWLVIMLSLLFGSAYALLQAALYGLAGPSADLLNNLNLGIGISGLSVNLLRIAVLASISSNTTGAQIFFYTTGAYLLLCTYLAWRFVTDFENDQKFKSTILVSQMGDVNEISEYKAVRNGEANDKKEVQSEQTRFQIALSVYKCNWKEAVGVFLTTTVQMAFFPGVMLEYQWGFIDDFSWFVITVVTFASLSDTFGRWLAGQVDIVSKKNYLLSCLVRNVLFTTMCLLTFFGVWVKVFGATWFLVIGLFFFAVTFGYWITLGFKYGADGSVPDQGVAGTLIGFHMTFGICLGSTIALTALAPSK